MNRVDDIQQKYCDQHNNGSAKSAYLFSYYEDFLPVKEKCQTAGLLIDTSLSFLMGISLDRNSPFFEAFYHTMMRLVPAGIPQKFHQDISQAMTLQVGKQGDPDPKVLTMDDLGFGFIIVLASSGVAAACFLCELATWPWVMRQRKRRRRSSSETGSSISSEASESGSADVKGEDNKESIDSMISQIEIQVVVVNEQKEEERVKF